VMSRPTRHYHLPSALRPSSLRIDAGAAHSLVGAGAVLIDVRRKKDPTDPSVAHWLQDQGVHAYAVRGGLAALLGASSPGDNDVAVVDIRIPFDGDSGLRPARSTTWPNWPPKPHSATSPPLRRSPLAAFVADATCKRICKRTRRKRPA
jgi:hypothetical protein